MHKNKKPAGVCADRLSSSRAFKRIYEVSISARKNSTCIFGRGKFTTRWRNDSPNSFRRRRNDTKSHSASFRYSGTECQKKGKFQILSFAPIDSAHREVSNEYMNDILLNTPSQGVFSVAETPPHSAIAEQECQPWFCCKVRCLPSQSPSRFAF